MKNKALLQFNKSKKENFNFLKFNDFIKFKSGVDSKNNISNYNDKTAIPWIKLGDIKNNKINFEKCDFLLNETKNLAKLNDLLVCWSTNPGYSFFASKPLLFSTAFYKFENKEENVTNAFIHFWLQKNKKNVEKNAVGSTVEKVNMRLVGNMLISDPSREEQTKIANCVTLLDKQIQLIERKLELYELRKKYYLNNIFCDDYSNLPKLRFEGFEDIWKEKKIFDLLKYEQPTKYIVDFAKYNYNKSKIPVLTANKGFILGYTDEINNIYNKGNSIIFDDFTTDFKYVDFKYKIKSSAIKILTTKNDDSLYFIFNLWQKKRFIPIGHNRHYISIIQEMFFSLPSLEEQTKIDNLFSSLDESIQNLKKQKDQLTKRKTYYLNNMFV